MITLDDVRAAAEQVAPYVMRTPLQTSRTLSDRLNTDVYLKLELFQKTGSFKPRGAFNQMLRLSPEARERGAVAVSGGNFAQAVAYAGTMLGIKTIICMPSYTPQNYIEATKGYGATVELLPDISAAFAQAEEYTRQGMAYLHPFDDPYQMAGCGTVGLEILEDVPNATDVLTSIGGGGLFAGVLVALKALKPDIRVWGVETEGAEAMGVALKAGKVVRITPNSLARTLGAPYVSQFALELMQKEPERYVVVSDAEAIQAQRVLLLERAKVLPELAASCTLAAADRIKDCFGPDDHVVLLLCGGNESLSNMIEYARATA
jgi:threonine dehydratase